MIDSQVVAFIGIAALLTITPGADTLLVMRSVLAHGQRAGLLTTLGICSGLFFHATVSALGLSLLLVRSATAFEVVKLLGAVYLIYLGGRSILAALRHRPGRIAALDRQPTAAPQPRSRSYFEGLITNVLNPKVAIFYLAFLPQFIRPGDPVFLKSILLAGIHCGLGIVWLSLVTVFLSRMRGLINRPTVQRRLEVTTGALLIAFGVRLALERR